MTDHAAEARRNLAVAEAGDWEKDYGPSLEHMALMTAQVHATLALAEEQRTANLVAALAIHVSAGAGVPTGLAARVDARLGLTPTTPNQEQNR